jgi:hypothetical protein
MHYPVAFGAGGRRGCLKKWLPDDYFGGKIP